MTLSLPFGLVSKPAKMIRLSLASVLFASSLWAAPSQIDDEAFLMFLADSIEEDGQLIDPLTMSEQEASADVITQGNQQEEASYE